MLVKHLAKNSTLCKMKKAKCHTESKPYIDFGCVVHFGVLSDLCVHKIF
jgi:hypothetical protein